MLYWNFLKIFHLVGTTSNFFPSFFSFLTPFLEYAIVTTSLTYLFFPLTLLPFSFFCSTPTVRFFLIPAVSYQFYLCPGAMGAECSGPPCCQCLFSLLSSLLPLSKAETAVQYLYPMNLRDPKQVRGTWLKGADSNVYCFINQCLWYDCTYSSSAINVADQQCVEKLLRQILKLNGSLLQKIMREELCGKHNYSYSNPKLFSFLWLLKCIS